MRKQDISFISKIEDKNIELETKLSYIEDYFNMKTEEQEKLNEFLVFYRKHINERIEELGNHHNRLYVKVNKQYLMIKICMGIIFMLVLYLAFT